MAAEAAADDAQSSAERQIAARMITTEGHRYLKVEHCRKDMNISTLDEGYVGDDEIGGG